MVVLKTRDLNDWFLYNIKLRDKGGILENKFVQVGDGNWSTLCVKVI